ncbi:Endoribonuclease L-PSP [Candidatus Zixiibacteriota bacterium]|nr:Endoribonuclease L-PSP [candidate division Zixibacteria bacterium]
MSQRINIGSGTEWEKTVGYSRVVRVGNVIEVSGTVAVENGDVVAQDNPYEQTRFILAKIADYLKQAGGTAANIVRTRIYVTNILDWEEVGRAHGEFFGDIRPVTSMVEVRALIEPEYLVEIEATAIIAE